MTSPTGYSWFPRGQRLRVPYEAPQGRRVNAVGALFTHGPLAGRLVHRSWASLPKSRARKRRKSPAEVAAAHGLTEGQAGPIDAERLLAFVWQAAGRPEGAPPGWRRERPLALVLDNYSVHHAQIIQTARPELEAAGVSLLYLPAYCPELSRIEPVWNGVKRHGLPVRSHERVAELKQAVDEALRQKAALLRQARAEPANFDRLPT